MLLSLLFASLALATDDCKLSNFSRDAAFSNGEHWSVSQKECEYKLASIGGMGKKFVVNLCEPNISFQYYKEIDLEKPLTLKAGSMHCPKPLFGVDFDLSEQDEEEFGKIRETIMQKSQKVRSYLEVMKDSRVKELNCSVKKLSRYLEHCELQSL